MNLWIISIALFCIASLLGALNFISVPDYENPADSDTDNVYAVEVTVDDGNGGSDSQLISVSVIDVNEPPVINDDAAGVADPSKVS